MSLKEKIIELRIEGLTYNEISKKLNCSKATISYHCQRADLNNLLSRFEINFELIEKINEYYKEHTLDETAEYFKCSRGTVVKYVDNKRVILTEEEKKEKNYTKVRDFRQKLKQRAVEYKGGECELCGYNKSIWSLQFHHKDKTKKEFSINGKSWAWKRIKNEVDKCILVCANCHGEIHEEEYKNTAMV